MIQIVDNIGYQGPKPNFTRDYYVDRAAMKLVTDLDIDDGHFAYCAETGLHYEYKYTNSEDTVLGKWREYKPIDAVLNETSTNAVQNKVINKSIQDLLTKYNSLKESMDNVDDLIKMDSELSDTSERGVQNKVLKAKFDELGEQISGLLNAASDYVRKADVQDSVTEGSTNPVQSGALYTRLKALDDGVADLNTQLNNVRITHLTDDEIEAIYKETRGIVAPVDKTRFDEIYDWYQSIVSGNEGEPDQGKVDYTTVSQRVDDLESKLSTVETKTTGATNIANNALTEAHKASEAVDSVKTKIDKYPDLDADESIITSKS